MKKAIRLGLVLGIVLLSISVLQTKAQNMNGQRANSRDYTPEKKYLRPSVLYLVLNNGDSNFDRLFEVVKKTPVRDKYNNHDVGIISIKGGARDIKGILENDISRKMIAKWFSRNAKGEFGMDLIGERGMYNATDADVLKANASQRKEALLKDVGENLLARTYIIVYDIRNIKTIDEARKNDYTYKKDLEGYSADFTSYVFKLNWNDSIAALFYQNLWVDANSPSPERVAAFDKASFPVSFFCKVSDNIVSQQYKDHSKNIFGSRTDEELFEGIYSTTSSKTEFQLANNYNDFSVKASIHTTRPISSKIGKKESVVTDKRFFVYEFEALENGAQKAERKGVIRATSRIADNRQVSKGRSDSTVFYQVAGRRLYPGLLIVEKPDVGIGITIGYNMMPAVGSGLSALAEINANSLISLISGSGSSTPGLKLYGTGSYNIPKIKSYEYTTYSYGAGISKDLNFFRNFVLVPFIGYGEEKYESEIDTAFKFKNTFIQAGCRLGLNLSYNIQLLGSVSYNSVLNTSDESDANAVNIEFDPDVAFKELKKYSPVQYSVGLRYQF